MGSYSSVFSSFELEIYTELTGLNEAEITHAFKKFKQIDPLSFTKERRKGHISYMIVAENLKELKVNPLRYRICRLFCSSDSGFMDFDDFLDMVAVFNTKGNHSRKVAWAFKIYDFNNDETIDASDIITLIDILTKDDMTDNTKNEVITQIFLAADRDGDGYISFEEFQHQIFFYPEFYKTFNFNL